jgi:hypothetical protein
MTYEMPGASRTGSLVRVFFFFFCVSPVGLGTSERRQKTLIQTFSREEREKA